jgi:hypothetical protein
LRSKGEGFFVDSLMWTINKSGGECLAESESLSEIQPTLWHTFSHVYRFILQAVKGDRATADTIFEDYLAGKLSEELLSISRRWVSADQTGSSKGVERDGAAQRQLRERAAGGVGVGDDAFTAVA